VNIGAQSVPSGGVYRPPAPVPTTLAAPPDSTGADATPTVLYARDPSDGDEIGTLYIPALKQRLPIVEGTSDDELKRGVGHFSQSVLPGEQDNCVLSGHRDTVFTRLGKLKTGDKLITQTAAGTFTYRIRLIRIVHKNDRTVIVSTDHAVLTVSTCYPFDFIGAAPDRYVLVSDLVCSTAP
jgi:sortase A